MTKRIVFISGCPFPRSYVGGLPGSLASSDSPLRSGQPDFDIGGLPDSFRQ